MRHAAAGRLDPGSEQCAQVWMGMRIVVSIGSETRAIITSEEQVSLLPYGTVERWNGWLTFCAAMRF
jgi:hypothetical protein